MHGGRSSCRSIVENDQQVGESKNLIACTKCKEDKPDIEFLEANGRGRGPGGRYKLSTAE